MGGSHYYMIYPVNFTKVMKMINHNRAGQFISTHMNLTKIKGDNSLIFKSSL